MTVGQTFGSNVTTLVGPIHAAAAALPTTCQG